MFIARWRSDIRLKLVILSLGIGLIYISACAKEETKQTNQQTGTSIVNEDQKVTAEKPPSEQTSQPQQPPTQQTQQQSVEPSKPQFLSIGGGETGTSSLITGRLITGRISVGSNLAPDRIITGRVMAPNGQIAYIKPNILLNILDLIFPPASALTGLNKVVNVNVYLIKTDDNGTPIGQPITFAVTDNSGSFTIEFNSSVVEFKGNFQLFVGSATNNTVMRAFLLDQDEDGKLDYDVDPTSEASIQISIRNGVPLSGADPDKLSDIVREVKNVTRTLPAGSSIEESVNRVTQQAESSTSVQSAVSEAKRGVCSLFIKPNIINLTPNSVFQFTAQLTGDDITGSEVIEWSVVNDIGSIDNNGLFTLPATVNIGDIVVIKAQRQDKPSCADTARVIIVQGVIGCSAPSSATSYEIIQLFDNGGAETHGNGMADDGNNHIFIASGWLVSSPIGVTPVSTGGDKDIAMLDLNSNPATFTVIASLPIEGCGNPAISGLAFLPTGYVAAAGCDGNIYKVDPWSGTVTTATSYNFGYRSDAYDEIGLAADNEGNIYVADSLSCNIYKIYPDGTTEIIAGNGCEEYTRSISQGPQDGPLSTAKFAKPTGIAVDCDGNLIVVDGWRSSAGAVRRIYLSGPYAGTVTTIAGGYLYETVDAEGPIPLTSSGFSFPIAVAVDSENNILVSDHDSGTFRKIKWLDSYTIQVTSPLGYGLPGSPLEYVAFSKEGVPIVYINYSGSWALGSLPGISLSPSFSFYIPKGHEHYFSKYEKGKFPSACNVYSDSWVLILFSILIFMYLSIEKIIVRRRSNA